MISFSEFSHALSQLQQKHGTFKMELSFDSVVILIAQVQLALRNPKNVSNAADQARRMITAMIETMEKEEPGVGELLRAGFDPQHDQSLTGG